MHYRRKAMALCNRAAAQFASRCMSSLAESNVRRLVLNQDTLALVGAYFLKSARNYYSTSSRRRHMSSLAESNVKPLVYDKNDTMIKGMEAEGLPTEQARAIAAAITKTLNDGLKNVSNSFLSNQEHQFSTVLHLEVEKLRNEIKEIDKMKLDIANRDEETRGYMKQLNEKVDESRAELKSDIRWLQYGCIGYGLVTIFGQCLSHWHI